MPELYVPTTASVVSVGCYGCFLTTGICYSASLGQYILNYIIPFLEINIITPSCILKKTLP